MNIADIIIGERHRHVLGDVASLAKSINEVGLLHPIGVTPEKVLIFGYRRLVACRDELKRTEIETREINLASIAAGEYAENELRKDFTPSERVAIMKTIAKETKETGRRGRPELRPNKDGYISVLKGETRKIAAKRAGFGSDFTARQAEIVVNTGVPELVEAMDKNEIAISAASFLARKPAAEQRAELAQAKASGKKVRGYQPPKSHHERPKRIPFGRFESVKDREGLDPNQRVHLWSKKVKDVIDANFIVGQMVGAISVMAGKHIPEVEPFIKAVEQMQAWKANRDANDGSQTDYARKARDQLGVVRKHIDVAYQRVSKLREYLKGESHE